MSVSKINMFIKVELPSVEIKNRVEDIDTSRYEQLQHVTNFLQGLKGGQEAGIINLEIGNGSGDAESASGSFVIAGSGAQAVFINGAALSGGSDYEISNLSAEDIAANIVCAITNSQSSRVQAIYADSSALSGSTDLPYPSSVTEAPDLGSLVDVAVLASSTITNTNNTVITGDLDLSPGTSVTGFPPGTVSGTQHITDATAATAQNDLTALYNDLAARIPTLDLTGLDLGGMVLTSGVYNFDTSAQLTGTLTLNALGNPNAIFIFQIGSTLTTASSSVVSLINGAEPGNVFWQVGSSATIGSATTMKGVIAAEASITFVSGASLDGKALARTAAVTLDDNAITNQAMETTASQSVSGVLVNLYAKHAGEVGNLITISASGDASASGPNLGFGEEGEQNVLKFNLNC